MPVIYRLSCDLKSLHKLDINTSKQPHLPPCPQRRLPTERSLHCTVTDLQYGYDSFTCIPFHSLRLPEVPLTQKIIDVCICRGIVITTRKVADSQSASLGVCADAFLASVCRCHQLRFAKSMMVGLVCDIIRLHYVSLQPIFRISSLSTLANSTTATIRVDFKGTPSGYHLLSSTMSILTGLYSWRHMSTI